MITNISPLDKIDSHSISINCIYIPSNVFNKYVFKKAIIALNIVVGRYALSTVNAILRRKFIEFDKLADNVCAENMQLQVALLSPFECFTASKGSNHYILLYKPVDTFNSISTSLLLRMWCKI